MPLPSALNSVSIPMLLDWWQQRKRLASSRSNLQTPLPRGDDLYLQTYYRLMEVYSVVKSGGVQAQMEAVKAFAERESALLNQQLAQTDAAEDLSEVEKGRDSLGRLRDRQKIEQDLHELAATSRWRLQALTAIDPAEEEIVRQHLGDIERTLMQPQYA